MTCAQPGCTGQIVDGYCDVCGMAPRRDAAVAAPAPAPAPAPAATAGPPSTNLAAAATTGRRPSTTRASTTASSRLGAGLVEVPPMPSRDPATAVMADPGVPESRRFCGRCGEPVGRSREGAPGRTEGFCRTCGASFSFRPKLAPGDLVAGQYEVAGCLAHGGMGWVYLARDHNVSDRWVVLKGVLNAGDDDALAAALAERRFLAEVEHPNIVKIFNFVRHDGSGYIVMEYVGGTSLRDILVDRRQANGGAPDSLPVAQAIAYMLEILPALGHLHRSGLLFCDFKLDNVIQTQHSLKLIDLGGVYRIGDVSSPIYGTVGYQAPEIADAGPSVPSDLFTVGRTLALECFDFRSFQSTFKFTLPAPEDVPLFRRHPSLHRFLLKATAPHPDDRFQTAEEMADQLLGVLREVVAAEEDRPVPGPSRLFTGDFRARPDAADWRLLPALAVSTDDAAAGFLATLSAMDEEGLVAALRAAPEQTVEVQLRLARAHIDAGDWDAALDAIGDIEATDPWEWRATWLRALVDLARGRAAAASAGFGAVYAAVPGELAPKLALGVAAELAQDHATAAGWYEVVARTDRSFTTAIFGLARCRLAEHDRPGALAAYGLVLDSSRSYDEAQIARIRCLLDEPGTDELRSAASSLDALGAQGRLAAELTVDLLGAALGALDAGTAAADPSTRLADAPLTDPGIRLGLERELRRLAQLASSRDERIALVDRANAVRPRTWT